NRPDTQLETMEAAMPKGWGYGGGKSASAANTRIRSEFKPWAYYNGSVVAGKDGLATVSFKLPDDLTTWRVMAVATDGDLHFGSGEATFIATKPLLSNPILPQFLRKGDRFEGGLSVTNNTNKQGNLTVKGELDDNIEFVAKRSKSSETLRAKLGTGTEAYRFPMEANRPGEATVRFVTEMGRRMGDAFEVSLPVQSLSVSETVVESGTTSDRAVIPLNTNKNVVSDVGGLEVTMASTLIPEITAPAKDVFREDRLPFLEPAASQLAIAANLQILGNKYGQAFGDFEPAKQAALALEKLAKLQQPDGGFAYYPGMEYSDPFVTPYAAEAIAKAIEAFPYLVKPEIVDGVEKYLASIWAEPGQYEYCDEELCKSQIRLGAAIALAEFGDRRNAYLADIYKEREQLDLVARIELARYLSALPGWQQQSQEMFDRIQESIYETGRNATINLPRGWGWLNSETAAQGSALRLFIARDGSQETSDRLLQSLLSLRRNGTWQTTYDNAKALNALVDYSETQPTPPNFNATASLSGQKLISAQFEGYENPTTSVNVGMDALPKGQSQLILDKAGEGTLHYLVEYSYRLPGNQPGRFAGLRVSREIRPVGSDEVLQRIDLATPEKPLTVKAGQVFDIGLEIVSDRSVDRVIIKDALPAGFEAIDSSFQTSTPSLQAGADSWAIGYQQIYRDRVEAYADRLEPGAYQMHYLVRSVTPGTFLWPGAEARLQYAPEEFGRSASATLEVK
ncbi:MAG: alpha-2-macroglobulin family protein, partial [Okeania sp. SIO2H7]|nr:alpha-2-macroglobulin family protein [Okeania sp. SIO2H7]